MINMTKKLSALILSSALLMPGKSMETTGENLPPVILRQIANMSGEGNKMRLVSKKFAKSIPLQGDIIALPFGFGSKESDLTCDIPHPEGAEILDVTKLEMQELDTLGLLDDQKSLCPSLQKLFAKKRNTIGCITICENTTLRADLKIESVKLPPLHGERGSLPLTVRQKFLISKLFNVYRDEGYKWVGDDSDCKLPIGEEFVKFSQSFEGFLKRHPWCVPPILKAGGNIGFLKFGRILSQGNPIVPLLEEVADLCPDAFCSIMLSFQYGTIWDNLLEINQDDGIQIIRLLNPFFPPYTSSDFWPCNVQYKYGRQLLRYPDIIPTNKALYGQYDGNLPIIYTIDGIEKKTNVLRSNLFDVFISEISLILPSHQLTVVKRLISVLEPHHLMNIPNKRGTSSLLQNIMHALFKTIKKSLKLSDEEFEQWRQRVCTEEFNPLNENVIFDF